MQAVFICGTGRSGTSIFTKLLDCHPEVWAFKWESQIFSGVPGLGDLVLEGFDSALVGKFVERVKGHLFKRSVRGAYDAGLFEIIDEPALLALLDVFERDLRVAKDESERVVACRRLSDSIFLPAARASSARVWGEKTPRNLLYADLIAKIYPDAKFIHVVRDGRDVVSSILEKKFWPVAKSKRYASTSNFFGDITFEKVADYWANLIDIGLEQEARIGPERWLNVRFEDFSSGVEDAFGHVYEFLGVPQSADVVAKMSKHVRQNSTNTERWRRDLSDEQIKRIMDVSEPNLRRFGYL